MIAAAGLAFGSLTAASAAAGHGGPPSIEQQAAKVKAEDAYTPKNGNTEMNVNVLEDQIEHYYGSASATFPVVGTVTVPSPSSNYAKQMQQIVASAESYLGRAIHQHHGTGKPTVVFDIDDTLLNTFDYTLAEQFGFTSASNAIWVNAGAFPAVFYMPGLVSYAASHGYAVFFITGRPSPRPTPRLTTWSARATPSPRPGTCSSSRPRRRRTCTAPTRRAAPRSSTSPAPAPTSPARATRSSPTSATSTATCSAATPVTRSRSPTRCTTSPDHSLVRPGPPRPWRAGPPRDDGSRAAE